MSSAENPENPEKIEKTKEKRVLTEAQLQVLKLAREKAMEKRKQLGDVKRKEKQIKEDKLSERLEKIAQIESAKSAKLSKKKKKKVESSSSSSSYSSSSESDSSEAESEEAKPRRSKPIPIAKNKARVARAIVNTQKASHEALTNEMVRQELKERIMRQNYANAFASIFPGKQNPYNRHES